MTTRIPKVGKRFKVKMFDQLGCEIPSEADT